VTAGIDAFEGSYLDHARRTLQGDEAAGDVRRDEAS
jgi:hypothetical protein